MAQYLCREKKSWVYLMLKKTIGVVNSFYFVSSSVYINVKKKGFYSFIMTCCSIHSTSILSAQQIPISQSHFRVYHHISCIHSEEWFWVLNQL